MQRKESPSMVGNDRYGVIIQARTGSSRFPNKVLEDIEGQPMLLRQLQRLKHGLSVPKLVVATSREPGDNEVEELCLAHGFNCYRGPLDDVMLRFIECAQSHRIDFIIRVAGDDPLIDWNCCNTLMEWHQGTSLDFMYASNRAGWPFGCAAELISRKALETIHSKTQNAFYLEHTCPYFYDHPDEFRMMKVAAPEHLNRPDYSFTVDYPEDLVFIRRIFTEMRREGIFFPLQMVVDLIDANPVMRDVNKHLHEGFDR